MSTSPMVSFLLRSEPPISTRFTPGSAASRSRMPSASGNICPSRNIPLLCWLNPMLARMFASRLPPITEASFPFLAAASSSFSLLIFSRWYSSLIVLGPSPCTLPNPSKSTGSSFFSFVYVETFPVCRYSAILAEICSPTPGISRSLPCLQQSAMSSGSASMFCAAFRYALGLNSTPLISSISSLSKNIRAMSAFFIGIYRIAHYKKVTESAAAPTIQEKRQLSTFYYSQRDYPGQGQLDYRAYSDSENARHGCSIFPSTKFEVDYFYKNCGSKA